MAHPLSDGSRTIGSETSPSKCSRNQVDGGLVCDRRRGARSCSRRNTEPHMTNDQQFELSRRQALLAGATLSLAMTSPVFAAQQKSSQQTKGTHSMTESFVKTKDGVDIFFKDWG